MAQTTVVNLEAERRRRAAQEVPLIDDPTDKEKAALQLFHAVSNALQNGAPPHEVERLLNRMDRILEAMDTR